LIERDVDRNSHPIACPTIHAVGVLRGSISCEINHRFFEVSLGEQLLEPGVLPLKLHELLGLIGLKSAVLLASAVVSLLGHPELARDLRDTHPLAQEHLRRAELADDLFC